MVYRVKGTAPLSGVPVDKIVDEAQAARISAGQYPTLRVEELIEEEQAAKKASRFGLLRGKAAR
jgi:hypothetical protein